MIPEALYINTYIAISTFLTKEINSKRSYYPEDSYIEGKSKEKDGENIVKVRNRRKYLEKREAGKENNRHGITPNVQELVFTDCALKWYWKFS